ncbi:MAG: hypothetical protein U0M61_06510 [Succinivibrio sp.]|nr:hypothetical protein [Succinivibrio sp.]
MFSNSYKIINITVFVVLATFMLLVQSAYADTYEDKARALSISFEQFCSNVDFSRVNIKSRTKVRAFIKARSIERAAGRKIRACRSDSACVKQVKFNSIKELHSARELKIAGYFGWSASTFEQVKAEAKLAGYLE